MTDEKQIERMAKAVSKNCDGTVGGRTCFSCRLGMFNRCIPFEYAKRFYKANGRILPENAVVLTKEEYELLKSLDESYDDLEKFKDELLSERSRLTLKLAQTRKETAREIIKKLKELQKLLRMVSLNNLIMKLEDEYGVEVEEL